MCREATIALIPSCESSFCLLVTSCTLFSIRKCVIYMSFEIKIKYLIINKYFLALEQLSRHTSSPDFALCLSSGRGQDGLARQASAQRHGRRRHQGAAEPHGQLQQAPLPVSTQRGRLARQPPQHPHAQRTQLQAGRQGAAAPSRHAFGVGELASGGG